MLHWQISLQKLSRITSNMFQMSYHIIFHEENYTNLYVSEKNFPIPVIHLPWFINPPTVPKKHEKNETLGSNGKALFKNLIVNQSDVVRIANSIPEDIHNFGLRVVTYELNDAIRLGVFR